MGKHCCAFDLQALTDTLTIGSSLQTFFPGNGSIPTLFSHSRGSKRPNYQVHRSECMEPTLDSKVLWSRTGLFTATVFIKLSFQSGDL
jgi:hypothetical protein